MSLLAVASPSLLERYDFSVEGREEVDDLEQEDGLPRRLAGRLSVSAGCAGCAKLFSWYA